MAASDGIPDEQLVWQVLCLRLAVIKCHARSEVSTIALQLRARGRDGQLIFSARWAELHPRTVYLLAQEAEAWGRAGPLRLVLPV